MTFPQLQRDIQAKYEDGVLGGYPGEQVYLYTISPTRQLLGNSCVNRFGLGDGDNEIVGVLGDNGAGKFTLIKIITGLYLFSEGKMYIKGDKINPKHYSVKEVYQPGIKTVYQEQALAEKQALLRNIFLGRQKTNALGFIKLKEEKKEKNKRVKQILENVGIGEEYMNRYPHEFSKGQRQRIGVARALAVDPKLIIADEPVSALDVSVQAQVINLLQDLQKEFKLTYLFIAHDLSVVKHISDRVVVMHLGKIVELTDKKELFQNPMHPYTQSFQNKFYNSKARFTVFREEDCKVIEADTRFEI